MNSSDPTQASKLDKISFLNSTEGLFHLCGLLSGFTEAKSLLPHATDEVAAGRRPISTSYLAGKKRRMKI